MKLYSLCSHNVKKMEKKTITPKQLKEMIDSSSGVIIIDSRSPDEFYGELGHISNSINLSLADMIERADWIEKQEVPVCIICNSGGKSLREAAALRKKIKNPVYSVSGGIIGWHLEDFEVV